MDGRNRNGPCAAGLHEHFTAQPFVHGPLLAVVHLLGANLSAVDTSRQPTGPTRLDSWALIHCRVPTGSGANVDIVVASARAYISALNKMIGWMSVAQKVAPKGRATASVDSGAGASNGAAKDEAPPALSVSM